MKKEDNNQVKLCPELQKILEMEIKGGNQVKQPPHVTDWPEKDSVFASLEYDFKTDINYPPARVEYSVFNDIHYGWFEEYYCIEHKNLLVAGKVRRGSKRKI